MTVKNTSLTDRLAAAAKAKQARMELFKPKAAVADPAFEQRHAERDAALVAVRAERDAAKLAKREAVEAAAAKVVRTGEDLKADQKAARDAKYAARQARK
jgi:hypothetical protein